MDKPVYGVGNASGVCGSYPHVVTAVVIMAGTNVISSSRVDRKRFSAFSTFVGQDFDYWWSKWGLIKVELSVNLSTGLQLWVDVGQAMKVEGKSCLW